MGNQQTVAQRALAEKEKIHQQKNEEAEIQAVNEELERIRVTLLEKIDYFDIAEIMMETGKKGKNRYMIQTNIMTELEIFDHKPELCYLSPKKFYQDKRLDKLNKELLKPMKKNFGINGIQINNMKTKKWISPWCTKVIFYDDRIPIQVTIWW